MNKIVVLLYVIFILILLAIWFSPLEEDQFFYIHDQSPSLSYTEILTKFSAWDSGSGGFDNRQGSIELLRTIFYGIPIYLNIPISAIQFTLFFILLLTPFLTMYLFLSKLFSKYKSTKINYIPILGAFFYTFNLYTLLEWHSGHFTNHGLHYALFPLFLFGLISVFKSKNLYQAIKYGISIGIIVGISASSNPPNVAALYVISTPFIAFILIDAYKNGSIKRVLSYLAMFFTTLILINLWWLIPYATFLITESTDLQSFSTQNTVYSNEYDSIFYLMNNIFKWTFFGNWNGRDFQSYANFYRHKYILTFWGISTIFIFAIILRKKSYLKNYILTGALTSYLLAIFLAKGITDPLGRIFLFASVNIPLFIMFRNPGNKFGAAVILYLTILGAFGINKIFKSFGNNKKLAGITFAAILFINIIFTWPFFTGAVVLEENIGSYPDNLVAISDTQKEATKILSEVNEGRILMIPGAPYGKYMNFENDTDYSYVGPDIFKKLIQNRIVYNNEFLRIKTSTAKKIKEAYTTLSLEDINDLNIDYILIRNDDSRDNCDTECINKIEQNFNNIYNKNELLIYKIKDEANTRTILNYRLGKNQQYNKISFTKKFPWRYDFEISLNKEDLANNNSMEILLSESNSNLWQLDTYPNLLVIKNENNDNQYGNTWKIFGIDSLSETNDNSITIHGRVYYQAQVYTFTGIILTTFSLVLLLIVYMLLYRR